LSYLNPPPAPAPVIVVKDYGGLVRNYEAQTEIYRRTGREVRVHECHSACTLALSLPNVCVYPNSIFKFHEAYDLRTRQTDFAVSQQLFDSYPATVRARLGTLTRKFKILTGTELIALGIRDCNAPRILMAKTHPASRQGELARVWTNVMSAFGRKPMPQATRAHAVLVATRHQTQAERHFSEAALFTAVPLPPRRPQDETPTGHTLVAEAEASAADAPMPQPRPTTLATSFTQSLQPVALPKVIDGAQPILPPKFLAYVMIARLAQ